MRVSELRELLENVNDDDEIFVEVKRSSPAIGPTSAVSVKDVTIGFDWDSGRILIGTEAPIYAGLENFERAAKFTDSVRNALYLQETMGSSALKMIKAARDKWFPKTTNQDSDPA